MIKTILYFLIIFTIFTYANDGIGTDSYIDKSPPSSINIVEMSTEKSYVVRGVALLFIFVGGLFLSENIRKKKHWKRVNAKVTDHKWEHSKDTEGNTTMMASEVFTFMVNGKEVEATSGGSSSHPIKLDKIVEIYYNPEDVTDIMIDTTFQTYLFPSSIILVGLFILYTQL